MIYSHAPGLLSVLSFSLTCLIYQQKKLKESDKSMTICNNWRAYKLVCLATNDAYYPWKTTQVLDGTYQTQTYQTSKKKISHDVGEEETSILFTLEAVCSCKRLPVKNNGTLKVRGISNRWLWFTFQIPFAATTY